MDVDSSLRICSLLPSTTEIVGGLGLANYLVAVTHECDVCPDEEGLANCLARGTLRVTLSSIDPHALSQADIDKQVKASLAAGSSLYALDDEKLRVAAPTVVLTQTLCDVCAPALGEVQAACARLGATPRRDSSGDETSPPAPAVHSFEPHDLTGVSDSLVAVATACGVKERGLELQRRFEASLSSVRAAAAAAAANQRIQTAPTVLLLEWIDPPFDGGGWVPDLIRAAGCTPVLRTRSGSKSVGRSWDDVRAADPDVVIIACCGFNLERSVSDAQASLRTHGGLRTLRAWRERRVFCTDGNRYFARPSQALASGAALIARCVWGAPAFDSCSDELSALVPAEGAGWSLLTSGGVASTDEPSPDPHEPPPPPGVVDVEEIHRCAVEKGELTYTDPATGFIVFTELSHKARGKCCGSGCRHCPYGHVNVKSKTTPKASGSGEGASPPSPPPPDIAPPSMLFDRPETVLNPDGIHLLFWSTGKDSFLALRALIRTLPSAGGGDPRASVVLLTTFDEASRTIAHQDVTVDVAIKQARHLGLCLLGVPLPRGGGGGGGGGRVLHGSSSSSSSSAAAAAAATAAASFSYEGRIAAAIDLLRTRHTRVLSACTGDLHLREIRDWRETVLCAPKSGALHGVPLRFPVWSNVACSNYDELEADLALSGVPIELCAVEAACAAACAAAGVVVPRVGDAFTPVVRRALQAAGCDGFGELGETHTVAKVWEADARDALGLPSA